MDCLPNTGQGRLMAPIGSSSAIGVIQVILPTDDGQSDQAIVDSSKASGAT